MAKVWVLDYQHIDCMRFMFLPDAVTDWTVRHANTLPCSKQQAKEAFIRAGWEGDGDFSVIWIPPFLVDYDTSGLCVWHVKQANNGTSWLCSSRPFDFFNDGRSLYGWQEIAVSYEKELS